MGLETFGFIDVLNNSWPLDADGRDDGNEHIAGIKATLLNTFTGGASGLSGAVTASHTELNLLAGLTVLPSPLGALAGNGTGTTTIDLDVYDRVHIAAVTAAIDFTFSNPAAGDMLTFSLTSAAGGEIITWNSGAVIGGPVLTFLGTMTFNMIFSTAGAAVILGYAEAGEPGVP